jgi:hypothetical protein
VRGKRLRLGEGKTDWLGEGKKVMVKVRLIKDRLAV